MGRPKPQPKRARTGMAHVRLWTEEKEGLAQLAETLGETPSRVLRRLIREVINGGPDYFEDGEGEIRRMRYELTRLGRNLNQFARAVNRGERVMSADLRRAFNACTVQMEAVRLVYSHAVEAAAARAWRPLYRDGGGAWPFGEQTEPPDGPVRDTAAQIETRCRSDQGTRGLICRPGQGRVNGHAADRNVTRRVAKRACNLYPREAIGRLPEFAGSPKEKAQTEV